MDSRGGTEMNHLRLEKSFRMVRLSKLIGGEKGLISAGSAVSWYSLSACLKRKKNNSLGFSEDELT